MIQFLNFQLISLPVQHSSEWLKIQCLRTKVHSIRAVDESWQLKGRKVSGGLGCSISSLTVVQQAVMMWLWGGGGGHCLSAWLPV